MECKSSTSSTKPLLVHLLKIWHPWAGGRKHRPFIRQCTRTYDLIWSDIWNEMILPPVEQVYYNCSCISSASASLALRGYRLTWPRVCSHMCVLNRAHQWNSIKNTNQYLGQHYSVLSYRSWQGNLTLHTCQDMTTYVSYPWTYVTHLWKDTTCHIHERSNLPGHLR